MSAARYSELAQSYRFCREVARREAKNFYWAFRALPREKSDAMCAVYAFMRKADDLADDESQSVEQRRVLMAAWVQEWRASRTGGTHDPVFVALGDTQQRFGISDELLEQLVAGTTMDLEETLPGVETLPLPVRGAAGASLQVYRTFDDLYRYCYLVASVVGLACIKVFGYSDPRAELLAEHTGVAFQLTNIVRDVKEDAERGRIYLPLDEMKACGVEVQKLYLAATGQAGSDARLKALLEREIGRGCEFYQAANELIPLLDRDSRQAMRVLVTIYRELLELIAREPEAVFRERLSVPTSRKVAILLRGLAGALAARLAL